VEPQTTPVNTLALALNKRVYTEMCPGNYFVSQAFDIWVYLNLFLSTIKISSRSHGLALSPPPSQSSNVGEAWPRTPISGGPALFTHGRHKKMTGDGCVFGNKRDAFHFSSAASLKLHDAAPIVASPPRTIILV